MKFKRVFLIVLDSFGIGNAPDADLFNDEGSNTLKAISTSPFLSLETMPHLGLYNIDGVTLGSIKQPIGVYAKMIEKSMGKDTTIGHWEIAGVISDKPLPTYPNGFTNQIIDKFINETGRGVLCNKPYSGTKVINDFGQEHLKSGDLIVYTSADSVFQIAAHEDLVPVEQLYEYCQKARNILTGENAVGRVIARPFTGEYPNFTRTSNRHDFSLNPPKNTLLDLLKKNNFDVISIGKINDIFNSSGVTKSIRTTNNFDGMNKLFDLTKTNFKGLCFANLVDFDMLYGHRNDVNGYAKAMTQFDNWLGKFLPQLDETDLLIITGDHGCDPSTLSTDHSRECTPLLIYNKNLKSKNLKERNSFADIGKTVAEIFNIDNNLDGTSFAKELNYD